MTAVGRGEAVRGTSPSAEGDEGRYAELFELAPIGLVRTDARGVVKDANPAAGELLGVEPARLVGTSLVDFVPEAGREELRSLLVETGRQPQTRRSRVELVGKDRAVVAAVTVRSGRGRDPSDLAWALDDVTKPIAAQRELEGLARELETRARERAAELEGQRGLMQAVIENIPVGILVVDRHGAPVLANEEAVNVLGSGSVVEQGTAIGEVKGYHLDGRPIAPDEWPMARTLASGEVVRGERYEIVRDGRHSVVEISTAPVASPVGDPAAGLAVLRDVTMRELSERVEREFVTNAAHELQSPLAAIVSTVEVLQSGAKDGPQRDVFLAHLERETERMARLVRALLILARTQMGLEAPRDELVSVCELLREIGSDLRLATGVELEIDCVEKLALLTNRELVEQAVVNLAENAAKQTSVGRVLLSAREIDGGRVEITVADTGPGIPAADRPMVFERFYRAGGDTSGGFGLGLAIVRAVADALDGDFELDSTVGVGTLVRLRLPGAAALVAS